MRRLRIGPVATSGVHQATFALVSGREFAAVTARAPLRASRRRPGEGIVMSSATIHPFDADLSIEFLLGEKAADLADLAPRPNPALDRPIFVIGCPRSGTTLLGACLAAHDQLAGGEESLFLVDLWRVLADLGRGCNRRGWAPLAGYLGGDELVAACGGMADAVFTCLLERRRRARYVDHTPWYAALVPFITLIYPSAQFVHLVRDGRQVVRSLGDSYAGGFGWAGSDVAGRAHLWSTLVERARTAGRALPEDRYLELRYEDLCAAPRPALSRVLAFADLPWQEEVLLPLAVAHASPSRAAATAQVSRAGDGRVSIAPRPAETGWPDRWTALHRHAFTSAAGETLASLSPPIWS